MKEQLSPAEKAFREETGKLPGNEAARDLLQQLPREDLEDLAHGLITHMAGSLADRSVIAALKNLNDWYATAEAMAVRIKDLKRYSEYNHDQDQISRLEKRLAETPPEQVPNIRSLNFRIQQFRKKWAADDPKPTWPPPVPQPQPEKEPHA